MELPKSADIVIIGGGVMGASTAYHLALAGCKNIVLLEKEDFFGTGATGRCAGGVRYQFGTEINVRLSLESLPMLERFKDEIGQDINYRKTGYLFILTNPDDVTNFLINVGMQNRLGAGTEWMSIEDIRRLVPSICTEDVLAGCINRRDGLVDPNSVVMGYVNAAQRLGCKAFSSAPVVDIHTTSGSIAGVKTTSQTISTPIVVDATGPWISLTGRMVGLDIPVSPIRRQWLTTTPLPNLPPDFPFVIDFAQSLYFHPEGLGVLTGMSNPMESPGFDQSIDPDWELMHMEAAVNRMPMLEHAGLSSRMAGLYEVTPDAHPIFGKTPVDGYYIVTGFSGHGFMHGPVAGKIMSEIILNGKASTVDVSMLDLQRFTEGRLIHEYNVV